MNVPNGKHKGDKNMLKRRVVKGEEEIKKIAVLRAYLNEPRVVVDKFTGLKMIQHKEMREFKFD